MEHKIIVQQGSVSEVIEHYNSQDSKGKQKLSWIIVKTCRRDLLHLSYLFSDDPNRCLLEADKEIIEFAVKNFEDINEFNEDENLNLELLASRALDEGWNSVFDECVKKAYELGIETVDVDDYVLSFFIEIIIHCVTMGYYEKARYLHNNIHGDDWSNAKGVINENILNYAIEAEDVDTLHFLNELDSKILKDRLALSRQVNDKDYIDVAVKYYIQGEDRNIIVENMKKYVCNDLVLLAVIRYDKEIHSILIQNLLADI